MSAQLQRTMSLWDMIASLTSRTFAALANVGHMVPLLHEAVERAEHERHILLQREFWQTMRDDLDDIGRVSIELDLDATIQSVRYAVSLLSGDMEN